MQEALKHAVDVPLQVIRISNTCWPHLVTMAHHGNINTKSDLQVCSLYPSIHPSIHSSILPSIHPSLHPPITPSLPPPINHSLHQSLPPPITQSLHQSLPPSTNHSLPPPITPSLHQSLPPSLPLKVGAISLKTGIQGAKFNVDINLESLTDEEFKSHVKQLAEESLKTAEIKCSEVLQCLLERNP